MAHLQVLLWVPVAVIDDDRVGRSQVDAQATRARGQQEHPCGGVRVEGGDGSLALLNSVRCEVGATQQSGKPDEPLQEV